MTANKTLKPSRQSDELLKGVFEENFFDFLRFIYPNAEDIFDLGREIQFMDKELLKIVPNRDREKGKRVADLLAKVYLKDGSEKWILVHTEIEGGSDDDFAFRIFQYHYRLLDRYGGPLETIAIYTGNKNQHRPTRIFNNASIRKSIFCFAATISSITMRKNYWRWTMSLR